MSWLKSTMTMTVNNKENKKMPEISINTDITLNINTTCIYCGAQLDTNIIIDSHQQRIDISVDPNHNCVKDDNFEDLKL